MSKKKSESAVSGSGQKRRRFTEEFKAEAVQTVLDGHSVSSVCEPLGLPSAPLLHRRKRDLVECGGKAAVGLESRVRELESELRRVERERERERDILKKHSAFSAGTRE